MKILLADDHKLFLEGVTVVLNSLRSDLNIRCVYDGISAFDAISKNSYDIAIVDLRLPSLNGFSLLKKLKESFNLTPVVILSASENPQDITHAAELGALGFISKKHSGEHLLTAIDEVLSGGLSFHTRESSIEGHNKQWAKQHNITTRQLEVLRLMKKGLSNQDIAKKLFISPSTVKSHVSAILTSLIATTRSEAIDKAHQLGLD